MLDARAHVLENARRDINTTRVQLALGGHETYLAVLTKEFDDASLGSTPGTVIRDQHSERYRCPSLRRLVSHKEAGMRDELFLHLPERHMNRSSVMMLCRQERLDRLARDQIGQTRLRRNVRKP